MLQRGIIKLLRLDGDAILKTGVHIVRLIHKLTGGSLTRLKPLSIVLDVLNLANRYTSI